MEKTSWKTLVDFKRVSSSSLLEKEQTYTISKITDPQEIIAENGRKGKVPLCYFKETELPLALNKTNFKTLEKLFNSEFREDWYGKRITIFVKDGIKFGNDIVQGIRVRDYLPAQPKIEKCADCQSEIVSANGMTAEAIANYTEKKYGVRICSECGKIRKDKMEGNK